MESEIDSAISHLNIYKKIIDENIDGVLIFEDYVKFDSKDILYNLESLRTRINSDNYVFQLDGRLMILENRY